MSILKDNNQIYLQGAIKRNDSAKNELLAKNVEAGKIQKVRIGKSWGYNLLVK